MRNSEFGPPKIYHILCVISYIKQKLVVGLSDCRDSLKQKFEAQQKEKDKQKQMKEYKLSMQRRKSLKRGKTK